MDIRNFYPVGASYFYSFIIVALVVCLSSWMVAYKIHAHFKPAAYFSFILGQVVLLANFLVLQALLSL